MCRKLFVRLCMPSYNHILYFIQEKNAKEIVLKAMGQAISKTVAIAEILKVIFLQDVLLLLLICSLKFMQMKV